jgi:hypothetical protein
MRPTYDASGSMRLVSSGQVCQDFGRYGLPTGGPSDVHKQPNVTRLSVNRHPGNRLCTFIGTPHLREWL